jgi:hypothetical protein
VIRILVECCSETSQSTSQAELTERALAKQTVLGRGGLRWWVLNLRSGRSARLAHGVCAMHLEEVLSLSEGEGDLAAGLNKAEHGVCALSGKDRW